MYKKGMIKDFGDDIKPFVDALLIQHRVFPCLNGHCGYMAKVKWTKQDYIHL